MQTHPDIGLVIGNLLQLAARFWLGIFEALLLYLPLIVILASLNKLLAKDLYCSVYKQ
jgi:hypothetical protein